VNWLVMVVAMLWLALFLASGLAPVVGAIRSGPRGAIRGGAAAVGACLAYGLVAAAIGVAEGSWGVWAAGLWIAVAIGLLGLGLSGLGWREAWRRPSPAGLCRACGYPMHGSERCPECGGVVRTDGIDG
jgi:hypothetical protein